MHFLMCLALFAFEIIFSQNVHLTFGCFDFKYSFGCAVRTCLALFAFETIFLQNVHLTFGCFDFNFKYSFGCAA